MLVMQLKTRAKMSNKQNCDLLWSISKAASLFFAAGCFKTLQLQGVFLHYCPDYSSCLAHSNCIGWVT